MNNSRLTLIAVAALLATTAPTLPSMAQGSDQNCAIRVRADLENSVLARGQQGVYFDLNKDLVDTFELNAETAEGLAEVAAALSARNTRLIAVPVPSRGLALRDMLDRDDPQQRAFGVLEARTGYARLVTQLRSLGILVADLQDMVDNSAEAREFFFKRDAVWTPEGARSAADKVARLVRADPVYGALPKTVYRTRKVATAEHQSATSLAIQRACPQGIEPEMVTRYRTAADATPLDFAGDAGSRKRPLLVLAGSDYSAFAMGNFDGFLSELTGLEVLSKSGSDQSVYASLITALTEPGFRDAAPRYLVWEFPVEANLNLLSFVAFRQILPALQGGCEARSAGWRAPARTIVESGTFALPGDTSPTTRQSVLNIATTDRSVKNLTVKIRYRSGETETIRLGGLAAQGGSGRFITSFSPEVAEPVSEIEVSGLSKRGTEVELQICQLRTKQGA